MLAVLLQALSARRTVQRGLVSGQVEAAQQQVEDLKTKAARRAKIAPIDPTLVYPMFRPQVTTSAPPTAPPTPERGRSREPHVIYASGRMSPIPEDPPAFAEAAPAEPTQGVARRVVARQPRTAIAFPVDPIDDILGSDEAAMKSIKPRRVILPRDRSPTRGPTRERDRYPRGPGPIMPGHTMWDAPPHAAPAAPPDRPPAAPAPTAPTRATGKAVAGKAG